MNDLTKGIIDFGNDVYLFDTTNCFRPVYKKCFEDVKNGFDALNKINTANHKLSEKLDKFIDDTSLLLSKKENW